MTGVYIIIELLYRKLIYLENFTWQIDTETKTHYEDINDDGLNNAPHVAVQYRNARYMRTSLHSSTFEIMIITIIVIFASFRTLTARRPFDECAAAERSTGNGMLNRSRQARRLVVDRQSEFRQSLLYSQYRRLWFRTLSYRGAANNWTRFNDDTIAAGGSHATSRWYPTR